MRIRQKITLYYISAVSLFGQSAVLQPAIGAAGYAPSGPLTIAPGQLLTLFVPNFGSRLTGLAKAPPGPLPTSLADISAVLRQGSDQPLPIFEVQPISTCSTGSPPPANSCGSTLAVTVQIPFNIQTVCPLCERPISLVPTQIAVSVNGVTGPFADLTAVADQVHFLTACDVVMPGSTSLQSQSALPCTAMVTHADGKLVSASNPARTGEELVAYASGLGQTNPPLTSAQAPITGAPTLTVFAIDFNYRPNALATKPLGPSLSGSVPPESSAAVHRRNSRLCWTLLDQLHRSARSHRIAAVRGREQDRTILKRGSIEPDRQCRVDLFFRRSWHLCSARERRSLIWARGCCSGAIEAESSWGARVGARGTLGRRYSFAGSSS